MPSAGQGPAKRGRNSSILPRTRQGQCLQPPGGDGEAVQKSNIITYNFIPNGAIQNRNLYILKLKFLYILILTLPNAPHVPRSASTTHPPPAAPPSQTWEGFYVSTRTTRANCHLYRQLDSAQKNSSITPVHIPHIYSLPHQRRTFPITPIIPITPKSRKWAESGLPLWG